MAGSGTKRTKIKKGDTVQIIAGRGWATFNKAGDRTPVRGRVLEVSPRTGKVKVEGAAMIKKHQRANPANNRGGGIIERESWIDISNVQIVDPETGKPTRIKYRVNDDGSKARLATRSDHTLDKE